MAKEFGVSKSLIYGHIRRIDRVMKRNHRDALEHYCHGDRTDVIQSEKPGRLPEGFGNLDPANDKQMGTILPLELFNRIEKKVDGVVFRNRSQIVRTALIEWLERGVSSIAEISEDNKQQANRLLRRAMIKWMKTCYPSDLDRSV